MGGGRGLGVRGWGLRVGVCGLGVRGYGPGFKAWALGLGTLGFRAWGPGFWVQGLGFRCSDFTPGRVVL